MLARPLSRTAPRAALLQRPALVAAVRGHCQVPCGIFDDPARVEALKEDAATVRKAMVQVNELTGKADALSLNQVRLSAFASAPPPPAPRCGACSFRADPA